ncbi:hypothetical protein LINPERHAP2_LOCUS33517 [Linum perenne]
MSAAEEERLVGGGRSGEERLGGGGRSGEERRKGGWHWRQRVVLFLVG